MANNYLIHGQSRVISNSRMMFILSQNQFREEPRGGPLHAEIYCELLIDDAASFMVGGPLAWHAWVLYQSQEASNGDFISVSSVKQVKYA
jgi:hypothetical protein